MNDNVPPLAPVAPVGDGDGAIGGGGVNAIFAKVPFPHLGSMANVETWFYKIEAWFELQGLGARKEVEKYKAVIAYLDQRYLDQVHDLVRAQPAERPYSVLKEAILAKFTESEMARLDKLANGIQLGDGRPSHLLSQLQRVNATNDESVVRRYWIKRLPPAARAVIVGMLESNPNMLLSQLAVTADAVIDSLNYSQNEQISSISAPDINAISSSSDSYKRLEQRIESQDKILQQMNNMMSQLLNNRGRSNGRSKSRYHNGRANTPHRQSDQNRRESSYCWYHSRYEDDARKCIEPCSYKSSTKN